jgi:aminopeptidase N
MKTLCSAVLIPALLLTWSARAGIADVKGGASTFEVKDYSVELALDFKERTITGDETVTVRSLADGQTAVDLAAADLKVETLTEGRDALPFEQHDGRLRLTLRRPANRGEIRTIRLRYSGKPTRGLQISGEQAFTAFHTSHWLVCQDDPAAKASLSLALIVPAGLEAVASGRPTGKEDLPDRRVRLSFRQDRPYSTYLFGFVIGSFREATGQAGKVALRFLSPSLTQDELRFAFRTTPEMLEFFEQLAGVPYPGDSYTQVLMPDGPPQEMAGLSLMSDRYGKSVLEDPREDYLIAHELAHQWWGNLVTCRTWSDFWLNEGMATYMVAVYKERFWGPDEYEREMAIARLRYENALAKGQGRPLVYTGWKTPDEMGGAVTYSRGALVLHLLRRHLGDVAFWAGLREFTRAGAGGSVDSEELRRAMERASGQDLRRFFAQWVFGQRPDFVARHRLVRGGVDIEIEQRQPEAWTFPLEIAVATSSQRISRRVAVSRRRETFHFAVDEPVLSVAVDPRGDLPETIAHERPVPMLLYQMASEPALPVRVGALRTLEKVCAPTVASRPEACSGLPAAVERAAAMDEGRLVRQLAAQSLERLRASPAKGR